MLKARKNRQSTRQLGGHGGEVHSRVNAVVDKADAAERHFAHNWRQDKIKQDNRKTRQDKTRNHKIRPLQDNTCLCLTVKADKQKFFFTVTFLTIDIAQCITYYTTAKEGPYSSMVHWALYTVHIAVRYS